MFEPFQFAPISRPAPLKEPELMESKKKDGGGGFGGLSQLASLFSGGGGLSFANSGGALTGGGSAANALGITGSGTGTGAMTMGGAGAAGAGSGLTFGSGGVAATGAGSSLLGAPVTAGTLGSGGGVSIAGSGAALGSTTGAGGGSLAGIGGGGAGGAAAGGSAMAGAGMAAIPFAIGTALDQINASTGGKEVGKADDMGYEGDYRWWDSMGNWFDGQNDPNKDFAWRQDNHRGTPEFWEKRLSHGMEETVIPNEVTSAIPKELSPFAFNATGSGLKSLFKLFS